MDQKVVELMLKMYCGSHHGVREGLCASCDELFHYASERLSSCPFEPKPVCSQCKVHCYQPEMRARIRAVMRYAGPRILFYHPIYAICHLGSLLRGRFSVRR